MDVFARCRERRIAMKVPEWFVDALENDSDKELAKEGKLKALDKVIVRCHNCGKSI